MLGDAGLELVASESHDGALAAMTERVEARLRAARMLLSADSSASLIGEAIELVGEAQRAIGAGSLGYWLFVARTSIPARRAN
jgi:hypothetical protein